MTNHTQNEFELIELIKQLTAQHNEKVRVGIGDDAAVCNPPRDNLLFCNDAMVENTHFRSEWSSPSDIGYKALASVLSDVAAMNGEPLYALVALALPPKCNEKFVREFYQGMMEIAKLHNVAIVGGDLARSESQIFIDVAVAGESKKPKLRSGAKEGDLLFVTGTPGLSAAGLFVLKNQLEGFSHARLAHLRPKPRFDVIHALEKFDAITSMIDISDGLGSELHHLAKLSSCGVMILEETLPYHEEFKRLAMEHKQSSIEFALSGGEDYELLFSISSALLKSNDELASVLKNLATEIGYVTAKPSGVRLTRLEGNIETIQPTGWNHFSSASR
jgi:thiamine-monophosphate kinase